MGSYAARTDGPGGAPALTVMVSNASGMVAGYLAGRFPGRIGHLYSPGGQRGPWPFVPYALDNGAFGAFANQSAWDEGAWRSLLRWSQLSFQRPLWALVPDVVADRAATLDRWLQFAPVVRAHGFRAAFAVQDGMTFSDVPDDDCRLFIGGSTDWKESAIEPWCDRFPGRVHVARVNTWSRLVKCWRAGAVSVDGTGWFHKRQRVDLEKFLTETTGGVAWAA